MIQLTPAGLSRLHLLGFALAHWQGMRFRLSFFACPISVGSGQRDLWRGRHGGARLGWSRIPWIWIATRRKNTQESWIADAYRKTASTLFQAGWPSGTKVMTVRRHLRVSGADCGTRAGRCLAAYVSIMGHTAAGQPSKINVELPALDACTYNRPLRLPHSRDYESHPPRPDIRRERRR